MAQIGVTKLAFVRALTMHAKTTIVDGARAYVGSENLTSNSLDKNREMGILLREPAVVKQLVAVAMRDWNLKSAPPKQAITTDPDAPPGE